MLVSARWFMGVPRIRGVDERPRRASRWFAVSVARGGISMSEGTTKEEERADEHLADVEEGAGCTEIWEYLSERREE
jgi:hypothetical protein